MKKLIWALFLATPLWADPIQPETDISVPLPEQFRGAESQPPGQPSLAESKWFEVFQDPQLKALIEQGLANNTDMQIALFRVDAARAQVRQAGAQEWPQLGISGDNTYTEVSANSPTFIAGFIPRQRTVGQVLLNLLSWELDIWGRVRHQTEAVVQEMLATEEDRRAVSAMVVSEVASGYFNLLGLDAEMDVARRTLETRSESLKLVKARQEGGVATLLELRQAEQLVESARLSIPDIERRLAQQENNLQFLVGQMPGEVARGRNLLEQSPMPEVPAGLPSELLARRPDIRAAERRIVAREEQLASIRAAYFPSISLTGFFGYQSGRLDNLFQGGSRTVGFGPQLALPLLSTGRFADTDLAQTNLGLATLEYRKAVQTAFREVSNALIDYQKVREARIGQDKLVEVLKDRARLSYLRYRGGVDNLLSALDADRDLFTAQLAAAQGRRNELLALVTLYKALGGGWQPLEAPKKAAEEDEE